MNREERDKSAERIRAKMRARGEWVKGDPPKKESSDKVEKKKEKLSKIDALLGGKSVKLKPTKDVSEEFSGGYSKSKQTTGREK